MGTSSTTDVQWKLDYTPKSCRQSAARLCLLRRLYAGVPPDKRALESDKLTIKVANLYRMFLTNMQKAGWDKVQDNKRFQYVRNCPPVGVRTQNTCAKLCRLDHICPFCWVRNNVTKVFDKFEKAFFTEDGVRKDLDYPVKLISTMDKASSQDRPEYEGMTEAAAFRRRFDYTIRSIITGRKAEIDTIPRNQLLGGVVVQSVDFSDGKPKRYRGGLFVVAKDLKTEFESVSTKFYQGRATELTRTELMRAMVRMAPYPGGWLRKATPEQTMAYLDAMHNVPLLSTYGQIRGL